MNRAKTDQLRYGIPRKKVQKVLEQYRIVALTDIWVYPTCPGIYTCVVGALTDSVYIFKVVWQQVSIDEIKKCLGVRANGSLIY